MNMPVLYPLCTGAKGSLYNDIEIRLSLRSLDKYGCNVGDICIVGKVVDWLKGVEFIEFLDDKRHEYRDRNIWLKCLQGFTFSDSYLFMNDDHFMLREFDAVTFPYYYREGDMMETISKAKGNRAM